MALCWSDIHSIIIDWESSTEKEPGFIFNDFKRLLEHEGMGPPSPISHEAILSYYPASNFKHQVSSLIQRIEHANWKDLVPLSDFNLFIENRRGSSYGEAWGRIGVYLLGGDSGNWRPGIFIGFLIDGKDHSTTPSIPSKGPDFSIIIDFDESLHRKYPQHHLFKSFLTRMQSDIADLNSDWDFYHHLNDQSVEKINAWHPIHIRKPMLELFRGTLSAEDQSEAFINSTKEILQIIFRDNEVERLRNELL